MTGRASESIADLRALVRHAGGVARRYAVSIGLVAASVAALVVAAWPSDPQLSRAARDRASPRVTATARAIRHWGSFTDTLVICAAVYAAGRFRRRRTWRVAALAAFTAACTAGLAVNAVRLTSGRPRPRADLPDGFRGPSRSSDMQSFPSGHAGTAVGCGVGLSVAMPALAVPALINGAAVAVSSIPIRSHYPTDVLAGSAIGALSGFLFGAAARRRTRELLDAGCDLQ